MTWRFLAAFAAAEISGRRLDPVPLPRTGIPVKNQSATLSTCPTLTWMCLPCSGQYAYADEIVNRKLEKLRKETRIKSHRASDSTGMHCS